MQSRTQVHYLKSLPLMSDLQPSKQNSDFIFFVDQSVYKKNKTLRAWLKGHPHLYLVEGGEKLKALKYFSQHLTSIFKVIGENSHRRLTFVAIGGGSVGDFTGFVASIFKRGVDLIQMPSTWLAAIDSSHGGKNGLNVGELKNQIGTFHHPKRVLVVQELLKTQGDSLQQDALGELYKMALLTKQPWGLEVLNKSHLSSVDFWEYLPRAVNEKYRVVQKDPSETKGIRHFLNLGHTFGHVIELEFKIPHGRAVAIGLRLALALSFELKLLKGHRWTQLQATPFWQYLTSLEQPALTQKRFTKLLTQDKKKISANQIQFVCLKDLGQPHLITINIDDLVRIGKKYGFIK